MFRATPRIAMALDDFAAEYWFCGQGNWSDRSEPVPGILLITGPSPDLPRSPSRLPGFPSSWLRSAARDRQGVLQCDAHGFGRVDNPGFDQTDVFLATGVETVIANQCCGGASGRYYDSPMVRQSIITAALEPSMREHLSDDRICARQLRLSNPIHAAA